METNERNLNEVNIENSRSLVNFAGFRSNAVKSMKRICYLLIFTGIAAVFNSCVAGWVETEPSYQIEIERPARPGDGYIWIEGGWRWDSGRHIYVREPGYWARTRPNYSYRQGRWKSGRRGKAWVRGRWERDHDRDDR
jgi:hypothetical protein